MYSIEYSPQLRTYVALNVKPHNVRVHNRASEGNRGKNAAIRAKERPSAKAAGPQLHVFKLLCNAVERFLALLHLAPGVDKNLLAPRSGAADQLHQCPEVCARLVRAVFVGAEGAREEVEALRVGLEQKRNRGYKWRSEWNVARGDQSEVVARQRCQVAKVELEAALAPECAETDNVPHENCVSDNQAGSWRLFVRKHIVHEHKRCVLVYYHVGAAEPFLNR